MTGLLEETELTTMSVTRFAEALAAAHSPRASS